MANHKSAKKRIRHTESVTVVRNDRRSRARTFIKKVESAVVSGDKAAAAEALKAAQPEIMRGVSKGAIQKNTASRKMSRLAASVKAMA
ncbi:MAG: 30S ribosomal protein S20 [Rhodospirillaceae bacterium]|nr:30S ribosomal protein S20 [Rhodospirillaceae bacterium]